MDFKIQYLDSGVVVLTVGGQPTVEEARAALEEAEEQYRSWSEPRCIAYDVERVFGVRADVRRVLTDWRRDNAALIASKIYGGAYAVPSAILRGVATALDWVRPSGIRNSAYVQTREEAIVLCEKWNAQMQRERASE